MTTPEELNAILERIVKNQQTETDITVLRQWLSGSGQIVSQQGKYAVNLGYGQEIHIGDKIYQGADAELIRGIIRSLLEELKAAGQFAPFQEQNQQSVDELVQQVRSRIHDDIQRLHSTMPLWGVDHWVPLGDLFVDVNILEELSSSRKSELDDLWQDFSKNPSYRSLDRIGLGGERERISGLEVLAKNTNLMVVGKPGSGKTTYLQRVVTECNAGNLQTHRIPALIKLRDFVDDGRKFAYSLEAYFERCWQLSNAEINLILNQGRALLLLDGLDEVTGEDGKNITKQIKQFARSYPQVQVIVTCRTQSQESRFDRFDYVEVADFNQAQVRLFAEHWFKAVIRDDSAGLKRSNEFLSQLFLEENKPIRDLAITPILLSLTCAVFHQTGKFYSKRSKLYEEGLELLLEQWDKSREIERDEIYRDLSPERKLELLSYLAVKKFEQAQYVLFEQEEIEGYIAEFLGIGLRDSRVVLKAIASQHGLLIERSQKIWSFSHLTFQEYLVAKWFCAYEKLDELSKHIIQSYWREVFLLSIEIAINSESLLLNVKSIMDLLVANNEKIQKMLVWLFDKSSSNLFFCSEVRGRGFYLDLIYNFEVSNTLLLNSSVISTLTLYMALQEANNNRIDQVFVLEHSLYWLIRYSRNLTPGIFFITRFRDDMTQLGHAFINAASSCNILYTNNVVCIDLYITLLRLWHQLLSFNHDSQEAFSDWWKTNGESWVLDLKQAMITYLNLGHEWQFETEDKELLEKYYYVGQLLINGLRNCGMTSKVKSEIEALIFLPIAEIEKRKSETSE